ncbi:hypothetical protein CDN98_21850 [Roseateles terrae]|nr:hypothetical protein CDN98_21850 [Roseateles terrae]
MTSTLAPISSVSSSARLAATPVQLPISRVARPCDARALATALSALSRTVPPSGSCTGTGVPRQRSPTFSSLRA